MPMIEFEWKQTGHTAPMASESQIVGGSVGALTSPGVDQFWEKRWRLLASCVAITVAVAVLLTTRHIQWRWSLFLWGVVIGVIVSAVLEFAGGIAMKSDRESPDSRAMWRRRRPIFLGLGLFFGTLVGVISAAFDAAWLDLLFGALVLLSLLGGTAVVVSASQRRTPTDRPNP